MVVPNNHGGFPTKNDHFGVFWGYHHLRKHPYGYICSNLNVENMNIIVYIISKSLVMLAE